MSQASPVLSRRRLLQGAAVAGVAAATGAGGAQARAVAPKSLPFTGAPVIRNRAYVANERSGTISVIDTTTNTIRTTVGLGSDPAIPGTPQPAGPFNAEADNLKPFYNGHVAPHGLWLTQDAAVLLVSCRISGTVVALDTRAMDTVGTATERDPVLGYAPVGREPHLTTVHPNGREAWVAVRGEDYLEVLKLDRDDLFGTALKVSKRMDSIGIVGTANGPSMVAFNAAGTQAFVAMGKTAVVEKYSTGSSARVLRGRRAVAAPFSPFCLTTPDDSALYVVHKGAGSISVLDTSDALNVIKSNESVGPRANHVEFLQGHAYVIVGGPLPSDAEPDPQGRVVIYDLRTHSQIAVLSGPQLTGEPHAVWAVSAERMYVGHERGNKISIVDTSNPANPSVIGTVGGSVRDLGFVRQPIDVVATP